MPINLVHQDPTKAGKLHARDGTGVGFTPGAAVAVTDPQVAHDAIVSGGFVQTPAQLPSCTTANRPTQNLFPGACVWDSTLGKPIYWNGSGWRDAAGTAV